MTIIRYMIAMIMVIMVLSNSILLGVSTLLPEIREPAGKTSGGESDASLDPGPPNITDSILNQYNSHLYNITENLLETLQDEIGKNSLSLLATSYIAGDLIQLTEDGQIVLVNDTNTVRYANDFSVDLIFRINLDRLQDLIDNGDIKELSIVVIEPEAKIDGDSGLAAGWIVHKPAANINSDRWFFSNTSIGVTDSGEYTINLRSINAYYYILIDYEQDSSWIGDLIEDIIDGEIDNDYVPKAYIITFSVKPELGEKVRKDVQGSYQSAVDYNDFADKAAKKAISGIIEEVVRDSLEKLLLRDVIIDLGNGDTVNLGPLYQVLANSYELQECDDPDSAEPSRYYSLSLGDIVDIIASDLVGDIDAKLVSDKIYSAAELVAKVTVKFSNVVYNYTDTPIRANAYLDGGNSYSSQEVIDDPSMLGGYRPAEALSEGLAEELISNAIVEFSSNVIMDPSRLKIINDVADLSDPSLSDNIAAYTGAGYIVNTRQGADEWDGFQEFWEGVPISSKVAQVYGVSTGTNSSGVVSNTVKTPIEWDSEVSGLQAVLLNVWNIGGPDTDLYKDLFDPGLYVNISVKNGLLSFIVNGNKVQRIYNAVNDACLVYQEDDDEEVVKYDIHFSVEITALPKTASASIEVTSSEARYSEVPERAANKLLAALGDGDGEYGYLEGVVVEPFYYSREVILNIDVEYDEVYKNNELPESNGDATDYLLLPSLAPLGGYGLGTKVNNMINYTLTQMNLQDGNFILDSYQAVNTAFNTYYSVSNLLGVDIMPFPTYIPIPIGQVGGTRSTLLEAQYPTVNSLGYVMPGEYLGAIVLTNEYKHSAAYKSLFNAIDPYTISLLSVYIEVVAVEIEGGYVYGNPDFNTILMLSMAVGLGPEEADYGFGKRLYIAPSTLVEPTDLETLIDVLRTSTLFGDILDKIEDLGIMPKGEFLDALEYGINTNRGIYLQITPYIMSSDPDNRVLWPYLMITSKTSNRFVVDPNADQVKIRVKGHVGVYLHLAVSKFAIVPLVDVYYLPASQAPEVTLYVVKVKPLPLLYTITYNRDAASIDDPEKVLRNSRLIVYAAPVWNGDVMSPVLFRGSYLSSSLIIAAVTEDNEILDYVEVTDVGLPFEPLNISLAPLLDELNEKGKATIYLKPGWKQGYMVNLDGNWGVYKLDIRKIEVKVLTATGQNTYVVYTMLAGEGLDLYSQQVVQDLYDMINVTKSLGDALQNLDELVIGNLQQLPLQLRITADQLVNPQNMENLVNQLFTSVILEIVSKTTQHMAEYLVTLALALLIPIPGLDTIAAELVSDVLRDFLVYLANLLEQWSGSSEPSEVLSELLNSMLMGLTLYVAAELVEVIIDETMPVIQATVATLQGQLSNYATTLSNYSQAAGNTLTTIVALGSEGIPVVIVDREDYVGSTTGLIDNIIPGTSLALDLVEVNSAEGALVMYKPYGVGALVAPFINAGTFDGSVVIPSNMLMVGAAWASLVSAALYSLGIMIGDPEKYIGYIEVMHNIYTKMIDVADQVHSFVKTVNEGYVYVGVLDSGARPGEDVSSSIVVVSSVVYLPPKTLP